MWKIRDLIKPSAQVPRFIRLKESEDLIDECKIVNQQLGLKIIQKSDRGPERTSTICGRPLRKTSEWNSSEIQNYSPLRDSTSTQRTRKFKLSEADSGVVSPWESDLLCKIYVEWDLMLTCFVRYSRDVCRFYKWPFRNQEPPRDSHAAELKFTKHTWCVQTHLSISQLFQVSLVTLLYKRLTCGNPRMTPFSHQRKEVRSRPFR